MPAGGLGIRLVCVGVSGRTRPELTRCIQVCLDSHDILHAAATILSRVGLTDRLATTRSIAFTALVAADECAAECKLHGGRHHHCELCAAACLHAAGSLRTVIESLDALLAASSPNI